jgi:hypothetical protein
MVDDLAVEVVTTEVGCHPPSSGPRRRVADLQDADVERPASEVEHQHGLVLAFVEPVRQRRGGGLVDDPQHLDTAIRPASLVACRWASLKYAGT